MPNFSYRGLSGLYKGSLGNQLSDYIKIDTSFLELSKDLRDMSVRLVALEATTAGELTDANFVVNTISGNILLENTVAGSKLQDGTITGDKIVTNSIYGLTDANIATNAAINPSKIALGDITHSSLKEVGTNTHPVIDSKLSQLFSDLGSSYGTPEGTSIKAGLTSLTSNFNILNTFVDRRALSTTAQTVGQAINELHADVNAISFSGVISQTGTVANHFIIDDDLVGTPTETIYLELNQGSDPSFRFSAIYPEGKLQIHKANYDPIILDIQGTVNVNQHLVVSDNTQLGSNDVDQLDIKAQLYSDIIPGSGGQFDLGSASLPFDTVYTSDISIANGDGVIVADPSGEARYLKYNFDATVPPSGIDDSLIGYSKGSRWYENDTDEYVCVNPVPSGAVWKKTT
ncbi:MAG: hypothetical protein WC932_05015 [archaeon]|jgi:hypothetical protein